MPAAQQLAKSTAIVLWSDHGDHLGEKEHLWKAAMWERTNRIPMLIHLPGQTEANGSVVDTPVSLTDLYTTMLDLAGIHYPWFLYGQRGTDPQTSPPADVIAEQKTRAISLLPMLGDPSAQRREYGTVPKSQLETWFSGKPEAQWVTDRVTSSPGYSLLPQSGSLPVVTSYVRTEKSTIPEPFAGEVQRDCFGDVASGSGDYIVHTVRNATHRWVRYVQGGNTLGHNELFSYVGGHGHLLEVTNLLPGTVSSDLTGAVAGQLAALMYDGFGFRQYQRLHDDYGPRFLGPFNVAADAKLRLTYMGTAPAPEVDFTVYFNGAHLNYKGLAVPSLPPDLAPGDGVSVNRDEPNDSISGENMRARNVRLGLSNIGTGELLCELRFECINCDVPRPVYLITHRATPISVAPVAMSQAEKSLAGPVTITPEYLEEEPGYDPAD